MEISRIFIYVIVNILFLIRDVKYYITIIVIDTFKCFASFIVMSYELYIL